MDGDGSKSMFHVKGARDLGASREDKRTAQYRQDNGKSLLSSGAML